MAPLKGVAPDAISCTVRSGPLASGVVGIRRPDGWLPSVPAEAGSDGAKRDCGLWVAVSGRVIAPHAEVIVLAAAVRGVATAAMKGGVRTGPLAGARAGNRFAPASISLALDEDDAEPPRRERVDTKAVV